MRATAEIVADLRAHIWEYVASDVLSEAADRLTELDNLLDMAEANLAELVARLAAVNAALDQYDREIEEDDDRAEVAPWVCVAAIAKAVGR